MKIWHLISNRWNSAITEYALSSACSLKQRGHQNLFTALKDSPAHNRAQSASLEVEPLSSFSLRQTQFLLKIKKQFNPDIIMSYGGPETVLSSLLSVKFVRFRGIELDLSKPLQSFKQKLSHRKVEAVLTPSQVLARKVQEVLPHHLVTSIPLGCDYQKFYPLTYQKPNRPQALIFGRFDPVKGHESFFRIWRHVLEEIPDALLHIVGEPANLSVKDLERFAEKADLTIGQEVQLRVGRVANVAELMSQMNLGIVPSIGSEMIARVAQEFLLCGTPVVVSGVGALEEVFFGPEAGASWKSMDSKATASLIAKWLKKSYLEDFETRTKRGNKAYKYFSFETMGDALEALLIKVLQQ